MAKDYLDSNLPPEVKLEIFSYIPISDLRSVRSSSRGLYSVTNSIYSKHLETRLKHLRVFFTEDGLLTLSAISRSVEMREKISTVAFYDPGLSDAPVWLSGRLSDTTQRLWLARKAKESIFRSQPQARILCETIVSNLKDIDRIFIGPGNHMYKPPALGQLTLQKGLRFSLSPLFSYWPPLNVLFDTFGTLFRAFYATGFTNQIVCIALSSPTSAMYEGSYAEPKTLANEAWNDITKSWLYGVRIQAGNMEPGAELDGLKTYFFKTLCAFRNVKELCYLGLRSSSTHYYSSNFLPQLCHNNMENLRTLALTNLWDVDENTLSRFLLGCVGLASVQLRCIGLRSGTWTKAFATMYSMKRLQGFSATRILQNQTAGAHISLPSGLEIMDIAIYSRPLVEIVLLTPLNLVIDTEPPEVFRGAAVLYRSSTTYY